MLFRGEGKDDRSQRIKEGSERTDKGLGPGTISVMAVAIQLKWTSVIHIIIVMTCRRLIVCNFCKIGPRPGRAILINYSIILKRRQIISILMICT